jgi:acetyltransferase-like isoleucine patch superfamily enzyme
LSLKNLPRLLVVLLPWCLRRRALAWFYGYRIHPTARIGWSWIFPRELVLGEGARIGHLNVAIHLDRVELGRHAVIERGNWITGYPSADRRHFFHRSDRAPVFVLGDHGAVTKGHHFDCTDRVEIGAFTIVGGYRSQFLSHSVDFGENRQDAAPIAVGDHCFIGTAVVILGGAKLPPRSVLGAMSLLNHAFGDPGWLYAGSPARPVHALPPDAKYFARDTGFVT